MTALWIGIAATYAAFYVWYRGFRRPLTPAEVDQIGARAAAAGAPDHEVAARRRFFEEDDGRDFVMVNLIEYHDQPLQVGDVQPGETSSQVLSRYMAYMWPALLKRACHPVAAGQAAAVAMDVWGIEKAERWHSVGLMRYRSRRDLIEIAGNDAFAGSHEYKVAAMAKTIAFPIKYQILGGAPLVVGLSLFALGAVIHILAG